MKTIFLSIIALALASLSCAATIGGTEIAWGAVTPTLGATATVAPSPSPAPSATPVVLKAPIYAVCTNVPDGRLHVRFAPGDASEVRGYALEGEILVITGDRRDLEDGSLWAEISSPLQGWINAKYVCEVKK